MSNKILYAIALLLNRVKPATHSKAKTRFAKQICFAVVSHSFRSCFLLVECHHTQAAVCGGEKQKTSAKHETKMVAKAESSRSIIVIADKKAEKTESHHLGASMDSKKTSKGGLQQPNTGIIIARPGNVQKIFSSHTGGVSRDLRPSNTLHTKDGYANEKKNISC